MNIILWLALLSLIIYPSFAIITVFVNYFPNLKLSKWWKKNIIDRDEEHD